jgi:pimeloyl-ACP methyl ester carboxylesterase
VEVPRTAYATCADGVHVAFQVVGEGPPDLVFVPNAISHIEVWWEHPAVASYLGRLASFSRLILFDKRGVGCSDRIEGAPTLEARMDDVRAVMDAAGSERAVLCGMSEGGAIAAAFAATYPRRVSALVLLNGALDCDQDPELRALAEDYVAHGWGDGLSVYGFAPSVADQPGIKEWAGRVERLSASPAAARAIMTMNLGFDARPILATVSTPTLVIHSVGDGTVPVSHGREAAALISGARYVEVPSNDHAPFFDHPELSLAAIEEFVTGQRPEPEPDRVLSTVMFTDIVQSTKQASEIGDRRWKDLLGEYDLMVDRQLDRYRGQRVKTTGDGTLATFDGPGRAVQCGAATRDGARLLGLEIRTGLHTGEVVVRPDGDITGLAVVIANRISANAAPGEILVSSTVKDLTVGSSLVYEQRGEHELKGVPGTWQLFSVSA